MPKSDLTPATGGSPPPAAYLPEMEDFGSDSVGADFQQQTQQTGVLPKSTLQRDRLAAEDDGGGPDSRPGPLPKDNGLTTLAELLNENRHLNRRVNDKDEKIDLLRQQRKNTEIERDEAIRKHDQVNVDYSKSITDLNTRTEELRRARKELEEGHIKWANGAKLERQQQDHITNLKKEVKDKEIVFQKWMKEAQVIAAERDKLKSVQAQFEELEKTFNHTLEQLQARNDQLFKAQEDYEILQQKYSEASTELMRVKIESRSEVDDAFFISRYRNLQSDIRTWAQNYFWGEQKERGAKYSAHNVTEHPSLHDELEELSEDCLNLLVGSADGSTRPFIAEAYLWKYIEDKIFHASQSASACSKGLFWAHKLRPEMARMEKFLYPGAFISCLCFHFKLTCRRIKSPRHGTSNVLQVESQYCKADHKTTKTCHRANSYPGRSRRHELHG
jgi:hypothetical protein